MISELLDLTRIESGSLQVQFDAVPVTVMVSGGAVSVSNGMPQLEELRQALAPRTVASR